MSCVRAGFAALVIVCASAVGLASRPLVAEEGGFFEQEKLAGEWGGSRKQWVDAGVDFGLTDISETLSNPTGGIRQLTIYQGLLTTSVSLDLEKLANWPAATFYTHAFQISGLCLSTNAIDNLLTISSIEA